MTIDPHTLKTLQYHGRRMNFALAQGNQAEADRIQARVDSILDTRPKPVGAASDGEVIYDNGSPWVQAQVAVNNGPTERVLTADEIEAIRNPVTPERWYGFLEEPDDDRGESNGGGVGLLDRP